MKQLQDIETVVSGSITDFIAKKYDERHPDDDRCDGRQRAPSRAALQARTNNQEADCPEAQYDDN